MTSTASQSDAWTLQRVSEISRGLSAATPPVKSEAIRTPEGVPEPCPDSAEIPCLLFVLLVLAPFQGAFVFFALPGCRCAQPPG